MEPERIRLETLRAQVTQLHLAVCRAAQPAATPTQRHRQVASRVSEQLETEILAGSETLTRLAERPPQTFGDFPQLRAVLWWAAVELGEQPQDQFSPQEQHFFAKFAAPDDSTAFKVLTRRLSAFSLGVQYGDSSITDGETWFYIFSHITRQSLQYNSKAWAPSQRSQPTYHILEM